MEIIETESLTPEQKFQILELWNSEYPESLMHANTGSFDEYLNPLKNQKHFLAVDNNKLLAWAFQFLRDSEQWFAIIVSGKSQGKGVGKKMIQKLKDNNARLSAWVMDKEDKKKINGEIYKSPLNFYLKNEFTIVPDVRLETEKMSALKIQWEKKTG